jgi:hypothetical protein
MVAYRKALLSARPKEEERAALTLQKAIALESKSAEVRRQLARVKMRERQVTGALHPTTANFCFRSVDESTEDIPYVRNCGNCWSR